MNKTKVIEGKEAPALKNPAIQQGIRDVAAAQAWGEKNGYATVYWLKKKERVYAERSLTQVNVLAKQLEKQSKVALKRIIAEVERR
jgi:hypothetical protein